MFSTAELIAKYETYSDQEVYSRLADANNYSEEAVEAMRMVIDRRGGQQALIQRLEGEALLEKERARIAREATSFGLQGIDESFVKTTTSSSILSAGEVNSIIESQVQKAAAVTADKKVNADTIAKSALGCILASVVGGAFASLQLLYFGATSFLMILGTGLICYGMVKLVTKKSYNNTAVLVSSFLAFIFAWLLAALAYSVFGYMGG